MTALKYVYYFSDNVSIMIQHFVSPPCLATTRQDNDLMTKLHKKGGTSKYSIVYGKGTALYQDHHH
jgi:hypothetical protein